MKFDHRFEKSVIDIYKYICKHWTVSREMFVLPVRFFRKCSTWDRTSGRTTWSLANRMRLEMSTSTKLLDNRDQRVKWEIFEDRDTSMPELTFLCIDASPECDPNLGTRLTHFRSQSRASSPLRELHRADRSIFVRAFVRDGNMTKWFHLGKFVSSCRKRHSRIFSVSCRVRVATTSK